MKQEVILTINGKSHKLSEPLYIGGGKQKCVCPKCSLFKSHFDFCWKNYYGIVRPLCSILAEANGWDDNFLTFFQEYKIKNS
jgi:hypothetical protein